MIIKLQFFLLVIFQRSHLFIPNDQRMEKHHHFFFCIYQSITYSSASGQKELLINSFSIRFHVDSIPF